MYYFLNCTFGGIQYIVLAEPCCHLHYFIN